MKFIFSKVLILILLILVSYNIYNGLANGSQIKTVKNNHIVYNPFAYVEIKAESAIVYDIDNEKILFGKSLNKPYPLASISKIASSLVVQEILSPGKFITFTENDLNVEGNSGFNLGDQWSVDELNAFSLVVSSNDGITALARAVEEKSGESFIDMVNRRTIELGIPDVGFLNETGLDETPSISGGYGTAFGVAKLGEAFLKQQEDLSKLTTIKKGQFFSKDGIVYEVDNTNKILSDIKNPLLSKTGFTDSAGGNLMIIFSPNEKNRIVIVVLGSTKEERFFDLLKLVKRTEFIY